MAGRTHTFYRLNPNVLVQRMGEEMILLNLQTNRFYELNSTAARFWELLSAGNEPTQARQQLLEEFEVEAGRLVSEIDSLMESLIAENLLTRADSTEGNLGPESTHGQPVGNAP